MREECLYPLLVQLVAQGATLEESRHAGRRYTLIAGHQRLPISAVLGCLRVLRGVRAGLDPAVCGPDSPRKGVDDALSLCG